ncbi:MAG: phage integrase N-terminal SAM-like domain-containing protein [Candidatus Thiodiazotropha sp.]|nr:phage integrase N-terminal SAM-like domain-containing protein [Candidatus Thiodiazotropha sp.]MCM8883999.1 phage integrase N-terminal SAM-like domain-containing protein [Candidatus Thiodiazotropha sp.]
MSLLFLFYYFFGCLYYFLLVFHSEKHPCDCGEIELASFLEHLAINRKVSGETQGLALNA